MTDWDHIYKDLPIDYSAFNANALLMFKNNVRSHAHSPLIIYYGSVLTFEKVDQLSDSLALYLMERSEVKRGDRVAVYLQNMPQFVISCLAIWKAGAVQVNVNPMSREKELLHILKDSRPKVLICLEELYDTVAKNVLTPDITSIITTSPLDFLAYDTPKKYPRLFSTIQRLPISSQDPHRSQIIDYLAAIQQYQYKTPPNVDLSPNDVGLLTYTSGTTGPAKGAMNTHGNLVYNTHILKHLHDLSADDVIYIVAPLFHITGTICFCLSLFIPMPMILGYRFDPSTTAQLIKKYSATYFVGAITVFTALLNDPGVTPNLLSSLRVVYSGGAPVSAGTMRQFQEKFNIAIHPIYGLTETTAPSHSVPLKKIPPIDPASGAVSVGFPLPGLESYVVDENKNPVPHGEIGEISIKGPSVVPAYWEKPEETLKTFGKDGTLYTGDMGFRNAEGWFFIVDRKKDLIISSGYKIWPKEVEDCLYEIKSINECAVVGLPDSYKGEAVTAFVSLKNLGDKKEMTTEKEIIEYCKKKIAAYKVPKRVIIVDEIPKNLSGKVLRRVLRDQAVLPAEAKL